MALPLRLKFWGVRGAIPTPCCENLGVGGNTACAEILLPSGESLVIDGGSGVRALGADLMTRDQRKIRFFLTHFHWDHIQGIPFFAPMFSADREVVFHSARSVGTLLQVLEGQMGTPYFPLDFDFLPATIDFMQVKQQVLEFDGTTVRPVPLNHPQGAFGFRVEHDGRSIVYASDHEHGHPELDLSLRKSAQGADILIYDAQYTTPEYYEKRGWGHSTWLEGTKLAADTGAGKLILFHHDPVHDDAKMAEILKEARQCFPNTDLAVEGVEISTDL